MRKVELCTEIKVLTKVESGTDQLKMAYRNVVPVPGADWDNNRRSMVGLRI